MSIEQEYLEVEDKVFFQERLILEKELVFQMKKMKMEEMDLKEGL